MSAVAGTRASGPVGPALTVTTIDVTQAAPFGPHAFTCSVWVPVEDEMDLLIDWPLKVALLALLSNEYPMETTLWDEQVAALADRVNGVVTLVLFAGLLTVTPAIAGT